MSYSVSLQGHGIYVRYQDTISFPEFMEAVLTIHANPNYANIKFVVHDMTQACGYDFSGVDMTSMVAHELGARYTNPNVRPVVVSGNATMGELTMAFSALTRLDVGFFSNLPQAMAWIEAPASSH
jgi:hypothetical protein